MATTVTLVEDAQQVLERRRCLPRADPVRHNVILTLLHARAATPEPGRYWIVDVDGHIAAWCSGPRCTTSRP